MTNFEPALGLGILTAAQKFVAATKLHPILVNFTAALAPVSVFSDFAARFIKSEPLRHTAWWTLFYATVVTPFTAVTGWLFWMPDDNGVSGMAIHKWLGTGLAAVLFVLFAWRVKLRLQDKWASTPYLIAGLLFVAALAYQGHLGGDQVFSGM